MGSNQCPEWCNQPHKPGANPRRQTHTHKFTPTQSGSSGGKSSSSAAWISTYPAPSWHGYEPCHMIRVKAYGRMTNIVLTLDDTRALAADLLEMCDVLEAEQALIDFKKLYEEKASA